MSTRKNSIVFRSGRIGSIEIKNRLARSATFENAATEKGEVSETLLRIYKDLAKGGVGLIITGITWVYPFTTAPPRLTRVDNDSFIPGLKRLASSIHEIAPDCRVMMQLHHPGRQVINPDDRVKIENVLPPTLLEYTHKHTEAVAQNTQNPHIMEPVAPSSIYDQLFERTPRELTMDEIEQLIDAFVEGIRRAKDAGFDGVQLHAAHGWLLSSFLSPKTNQRNDLYGGSTENRTRIVQEIYKCARKKVGDHFPILIKFNTTDFLPGGTDLDEAIRVGKILSGTGFDALEVSGGMWEAVTRLKIELGWSPVLLPESRTNILRPEQEAYFLPAARILKRQTNSKIVSVGGYRSFSKIEEALESGATDFVSLSRPFIRQPDLPNLWYAGHIDKAACTSCNACLPVGGSEHLSCRIDSL